MSSAAELNVLVERFLDAETRAEAEDLLHELGDVTAPGTIVDGATVGDHFAELAAEAHEDDELGEAIRLQTLALERDAQNVIRETAVLAALRYEEDGRSGWPEALDRYTSARDRADAFGAFATTVAHYDLDLAFQLHDDAVDLALKTDDDDLLARVSIPRMFDRADHGYPPDEPDEYAAELLDDDDLAATGGELVGVLYLPREEHVAARERWPAAAEEHHLGTDAYFAEIEAECRQVAAEEGRNPELVAVTAQLLDDTGTAFGEEPTEALDAALAGGTLPVTAWPPGRNEPCWCGSGRKYKRCCG